MKKTNKDKKGISKRKQDNKFQKNKRLMKKNLLFFS